MQTVSIVGCDPPLAAVADRLEGRVAVVHATTPNVTVDDAGDTERQPSDVGSESNATVEPTNPVGGTTTGRVERTAEAVEGVATDETRTPLDGVFRLAADGTWRGETTGTGFGTLLDRLAPTYDYAFVLGASRLRLPTLVTGDREVAGAVIDRIDPDETLTASRLATLARDVSPYVTLETLVAATKHADREERAGAIATFTGRVRAKDNPDDTRTTHLAFEQYDAVAADRLAQIERELETRDGVFDVRTHHRTGVIEAGEDIVFVVVLAGHREQAFRAVSDGIDRLKDEVPIFKKEITTTDSFWRHERES